MSDEESFVILGTSPMASLEPDGINGAAGDKVDSLQTDTPPGSCFTSLKNSQINELENARASSNKTPTPPSSSSLVNSNGSESLTKSAVTVAGGTPTATMTRSAAESLLWSRPPVEQKNNPQPSIETRPQIEVKDDFFPLSLEDCAVPSPLTQSPKTSLTFKPTPTTSFNSPSSYLKENSNKENLQPTLETTQNMTNSHNSKGSSTPKQCSLASSFIMGEVNADVLKSSVYSQFPSISMQACAEDVVKLQNMVTEYMQLKTTLEKVNNTMKLFYEHSIQWKDKMNYMESHYKQQLNECQKQIEDLRAENTNLRKSIEDQVEQTKAVDVARQTDRDEMIRTISEKTALVENMRAQIVKLEEQQNATFEFLPKKPKDKAESNFDNLYITRGEHDSVVKDLKRQLSEMLASNLDIKDVEKQYIDEINCLKHNLASAEELVKQNRAEIAELQYLDADKQKQIEELQSSNKKLLAANAEQNERILLLEQQNQVHCKDFEMERESRQAAVGEKQQILQDLRGLQKRNQELIEEHQKYVDSYEKRLSNNSLGNGFGVATTPLVAAAAAAQSYIDNPSRPIRDLPSRQSAMPPAFDSMNQYNCPVCNKSFKSISVLTSHVNDCIDKN